MYGWCDKCDTLIIDGLCPIHGSTRPLSYVSNIEIRPLSSFEKQFFNQRMGDAILGKGVFFMFSDRMYRRKVVTRDFPIAEVQLKKDALEVTSLIKRPIDGLDVQTFIKANEPHMQKISRVTRDFAEWELKHSKNAVVSFSGGKDSVVLSHVLSPFHLQRVFIDTRLEFPETYDMIRRNNNNGNKIDVARAESNFFMLCKDKGFPGTGNRWCCKTQKFAPFTKYLEEKFDGQDVSVFSGERRWEGLYRMANPCEKSINIFLHSRLYSRC